MKNAAAAAALVSLVLATLLYIKMDFWIWDLRILVYGFKLLAGGFAPLLIVIGLGSAVLGWWYGMPWAALAGLSAAAAAGIFLVRVTRPHDGFTRTFGPGWEERISPVSAGRMLKRRRSLIRVIIPPRAQVRRNLPFWKIPGTTRILKADLWQPPEGTPPTGLGIVFLHSGGWQSMDKDCYTRPFFHYLAGQGHTILDVSYRQAFETDMAGITADVKRAVAWMKSKAAGLGVDPDRIALMGGSAGGHLALLAAYTPNDPRFDPPDLGGIDTSVCGVVSYYGLPDLRGLHLESSRGSAGWLAKLGYITGFVAREGYMDTPELAKRLFGGLPEAVKGVAAHYSPVTHARPGCPPTMQLQGTHDHILNLEDARRLHAILNKAGVPSVLVELPQAEHAFDLLALVVSPPAQAALYDVERFLALLCREQPDVPVFDN